MSFRFRFLLGWEYRCFPLSVICGSAPRSSRIAPPLGGAVLMRFRSGYGSHPIPFHPRFQYVARCWRAPISSSLYMSRLAGGPIYTHSYNCTRSACWRAVPFRICPGAVAPSKYLFQYVRRSAAVLLRLRSAELSHSRLPLGGAHIPSAFAPLERPASSSHPYIYPLRSAERPYLPCLLQSVDNLGKIGMWE